MIPPQEIILIVFTAFTNYKLEDGKDANYGYGWRLGHVYESPSIWHGGLITGYGAIEVYLPNEDVFVVIFTNCDCNYPKDISFRLAALASGKPYKFTILPVGKTNLLQYIGVYENAKGEQWVITTSGKQLHSQLGRGPKYELKLYQKDKFFIDDIVSLEFSKNKKDKIEKLIIKTLNGNEDWLKTNKPIPSEDGIAVDEKTLQSYVGEYEINPTFNFTITKERNYLFLQADGQEKLQMVPDTETKFYLKVNGAKLEFVKDKSGKTIKAIINQDGKEAEAMKTK